MKLTVIHVSHIKLRVLLLVSGSPADIGKGVTHIRAYVEQGQN